jgi:hypothetical protein
MERKYSSRSPGSARAPMTYLVSYLVVSLRIKSIQSALVIQPPPFFTEDKSSSLLGNEVGETIAGMKSFRNARQYELSA